jgi:hypothetical protein
MAQEQSVMGRANVWICKDHERDGRTVTAGCGYIGLYKPEIDRGGILPSQVSILRQGSYLSRHR